MKYNKIKFPAMLAISLTIGMSLTLSLDAPFFVTTISGNEEINPVEILPEKTELVLSMNIPQTLNPLLNADTTVDNVLKLMFKPLTSLDENFKPQPNLATQILYTNEENNIVATIVLDKTATWHDGTNVTAKDFIYSYNVLKNADDNVIYKNSINNIKSCEIINDNTVKVIFSCNYQNAVYSLDFPLIPEHYYKNNSNDLNPLGNNDYKFRKYTPAEDLNLTNIVTDKRIKILTIASLDARLSALKQGITDIDYMNISNYSKYIGGEFDVIKIPTTYYDFIGFNYENELFQNIEIRQAINYLINKNDLMETIYLGYGAVSNSPIHPDSHLSSDATILNDFSIDKAIELLENQNISEDLKILVNEENQERKNIAEMLSHLLDNVNIKSEIIILPFEEYSLEIENENFDILVGGYSLSPNSDLDFLLKSNSNIFSYSDEKMDKYLENVSTSLGEEFLKENMETLDKYIKEELPIISLVFRENVIVSNTEISDFLNLDFLNPEL